MSQSIIKVENLSKSYILNHEGQERYTALRDVIANKAKKILTFPKSHTATSKINNSTKEEFWALHELNFEINRGDRLGIIGRNGAGKSTLLKVLSRITEPTRGKISIKGRVASLLEVGTGFHPELTGRENIFLNGAILGMSRVEIKKHFDAIVDFAEVEKFLDTPVKRYSSGMYVRLAFAVAAHLEPEILIVDEVLAVGDAQFQKKCIGKLEDVSNNDGRTVLFVSHNLSSLMGLCTKSIVLEKGKILLNSSIQEGIRFYQNITLDKNESAKKLFELKNLSDKKQIQISRIEYTESKESIDFRFTLKVSIIAKNDTRIGINIFLKDGVNNPVAIGLFDDNSKLIQLKEGINEIILNTDSISIGQGSYKLGVEAVIPGYERFDKIEDAIQFELSNETLDRIRYRVNQTWGYGSFEIKFLPIT